MEAIFKAKNKRLNLNFLFFKFLQFGSPCIIEIFLIVSLLPCKNYSQELRVLTRKNIHFFLYKKWN